MTSRSVPVAAPEDLGPAEVLACAGGASPELGEELLAHLDRRRAEVLDALVADRPVYGVNTGMGALAGVRLDAAEQAEQSRRLLVGRAVGGPPWLSRTEARAVVAVRLRTFLSGDAGVSAELCAWLATLLAEDLVPAVPRSPSGSAGEIIPLAHAWGHLAGVGRMLDRRGDAVEAAAVLAGRRPPRLGAKEGVALLQGVPVATALARAPGQRGARPAASVDHGRGRRGGARRRRSRPLPGRDGPRRRRPRRASSTSCGSLVGEEPGAPVHLQAPTSFRVVGPTLAHLARSLATLEDAVDRALTGVTDSPAWLDDGTGGRFVGTSGFHGLELSAACDGVRGALLHAAEVGTARLHRLLDPAFTGLPAQLSSDPGPQAGLVAVHKRAVGAVHAQTPVAFTAVGTHETSHGQEDVQAYAQEAAERLRDAVVAAREVVACELLAVHQAHALAPGRPAGAAELADALARAGEVVPGTTEDRVWGEDIEALTGLLEGGWPG